VNIEKLLDRPIAFQRAFMALGAGASGALFLSQAVYWSSRTGNDEKWFYKTIEEWTEETGLSRHEQDGARKKLKAKGILEIVKKGIPCKTYYRVNFEKLAEVLGLIPATNKNAEIRQTEMPKSGKLDCQEPANSCAENQQTITEITTKTTTEITSINTLSDSGESNEQVNQSIDLCSPPANVRMTNQNYLKSRFEEFYEVYGKKANRSGAEKAFSKIKLPAENRELFVSAIIDCARRWGELFRIAPSDQKAYQPHPASWINGKRWEDEALPTLRQAFPVGNEPVMGTSRDQVNDCLTNIQDTNW